VEIQVAPITTGVGEYEGYVTLRDAVRYLNMSHMYVRKLVREGAIPHKRDEKNRIWVAVADLDAFNTDRATRKRAAPGEGRRPQYAYMPARVKNLKQVRSYIDKSDLIDPVAATVAVDVIEILLADAVETWQAKKAAGESPDSPKDAIAEAEAE